MRVRPNFFDIVLCVGSLCRPDCEGNFGVFAVKFSCDGRDVLAA